MADEILHSGLESDLRQADLLSGMVRTTLYDAASVRNVPGVVEYLGTVNGLGSDTIRVPYASLDGSDTFAVDSTEDASTANTALTDTSVTIAVQRYALARQISDLANLTARSGDIDVARLAQSMSGEYEATWMELLSDTIDGFTSTVGTTTVDLDVDDIFSAIATLELADVPGPFFGMLDPQQIVDLRTSLRAEGGPLQWIDATQEMLSIKGQGFAGTFLGIDFYKSSRVNTANSAADVAGAIWGAGAIGWASATPRPVPGAVMSAPNPFVTVEIQRPDRVASTIILGHAYMGMSVLEDSRGVAVITDA